MLGRFHIPIKGRPPCPRREMEKVLPKIKHACQTTRFFWEKVNGLQFHPPYSACDDFSVRIQIRKRKNFSWEEVVRRLNETDFTEEFQDPRKCTKNKTKAVASYRYRSGEHPYCQWGQVKKSHNWHIDINAPNVKEMVAKCLKKLH